MVAGTSHTMTDDDKTACILDMLHRCYAAGRWISPSFASATQDSPYKVLRHEADYPPGLSPKELERLLGHLRARGLVKTEVYRCSIGRRPKERLVAAPAEGAIGAIGANG
jgi:hypothetical protein